jgi:hypothetical protein
MLQISLLVGPLKASGLLSGLVVAARRQPDAQASERLNLDFVQLASIEGRHQGSQRSTDDSSVQMCNAYS